MRLRLWLPLLLLLILALAAWAPWITQAYAEKRAAQSFTAAWMVVTDGCGVNCKGCGAVSAQKTWFGYAVELEYACGLLPEDAPKYHQRAGGFVSFLGTVHGFPRP